jgi:hypothetical protein
MTTPERTRAELLTALAELSRVRPGWRLGQTLANVAMTAGRLDAGGVWDLEDEEALAAVQVLVRQYAQTGEATCRPLKEITAQKH